MELVIPVGPPNCCFLCSWNHTFHCNVSAIMVSHLTLSSISFVLSLSGNFRYSLFCCKPGSISLIKKLLVLILQASDNFIKFFIFIPIFCKFQLHILNLSTKTKRIVILLGIFISPQLNLILLVLYHIF